MVQNQHTIRNTKKLSAELEDDEQATIFVNESDVVDNDITLIKSTIENNIRPGFTLKNRFDILEEIGSGGMGTVYKALDKRDIEAGNSTFIAIKVLNDEYRNDDVLLKALYEETRKTQSLAHQNIVTVYDFDRDDNTVFMTMELIDGAPLDKVLKMNPSGLNLFDALSMINQMANALSYAHSKHIIHLDLKPNNIFIDRNKNIKILDFGISQKLNASLIDVTEPSGPIGLTPSHASLEALSNEVASESDDIYAFSCICYEILTGKHPFNKKPADIAYKNKQIPKRIKSLNKNQWNAIKKGLEFKKDNRTASIDIFLKEFNKNQSYFVFYIAFVLVSVVAVFLYTNTDETSITQDPTLVTDTSEIVTSVNDKKIAEIDIIQSDSHNKNFAIESIDDLKQPGSINIWLDKINYEIGSTLQINFNVDREMYVLMILVNSAGELTYLFPNPFQTDNLLKPEYNYQIPPKKASFTLDISEPRGEDRIIAFASSEPIPKHAIKVDSFGKVVETKIVKSYIKFETSFIIY